MRKRQKQTLEEWVQQRAMTEAMHRAKEEVKEQLHREGRLVALRTQRDRPSC